MVRNSRVCCDITLVIMPSGDGGSLRWVRSGSVGPSVFISVLHSGFGFSVRRKMEVTDKCEHTSHDVLSTISVHMHVICCCLCSALCSWIWLVFKVHTRQEQHCVFNSMMGQKQITLFSSVMDNLVFLPSCTLPNYIFANSTAPSCC